MIELKNIFFRYTARDIGGINNASFKINKGESCALMGASGSGKSTLLKIISQEITPQKGEVKTAAKFKISKNQENIDLEEILMNFITQKDQSENSINLARDLLAQFELPSHIHFKLSSLSQGQLERAKLCRLLHSSPDLIILDEPFASIDSSLKFELMKELKQYISQSNRSLIWATHDIELALNFSDKIILLEHGKIVENATPLDFIQRPTHAYTLSYLSPTNKVVATVSSIKTVNSSLGEMTLENLPGEKVSLMVIPHRAWELSEERTDYWGKVVDRRITVFGVLLKVALQKQLVDQWAWVSFEEAQKHKTGDSVSLKLNTDLLHFLPI